MPNRDELFSAAFYRAFILNGVRVVFIVLFAWVAMSVTRRIIRGVRRYVVRVMLKSNTQNEFEVQKRADTITSVVGKSIISVIWAVALIMVLQELNFDVKPLLAGAGIVGVAVGLGAQTMVKDVLAGFFLLLENQIRVHDVAVINGVGGVVEEINLRTTILRAEDGAVHVFPNGNITQLANLTRDYSYCVFAVSVGYREDTDRVVGVLKELGAELMNAEPFHNSILAPLEIMGVDQLAESAVIVKARFKTQPMKQWDVGREMNRRIKKRFEEAGIQVPYPARTVHLNRDGSPEWKEELREIVRGVLKEGGPRTPERVS